MLYKVCVSFIVWIESCSKYHDYLESNLVAVTDYQSLEEPNHAETIIQLVHFYGPLRDKYKSQIESSVVETIKEKLDNLDFYKLLCLDRICPKGKVHHYIFLKHVKENGFSIKNVILFTKHYGPASRYTHSVWKEEGTESLTNRQETINKIGKTYLKFSLVLIKLKVRLLCLYSCMIKYHLLNSVLCILSLQAIVVLLTTQIQNLLMSGCS